MDESEERIIRRRSSKACDNCRKAKCKCEPTGPGQPCGNCASLRLSCTFLGPSRKRGPPKGYIDKLEAKMHRLQALIGTLMLSDDPRAQSVISDLSQDALAREVLAQVESSPFGSAGRTGHIPMPSLRFDDMEEALIMRAEEEASHAGPSNMQSRQFTFAAPLTANFTASATDWQNTLHARLRGDNPDRHSGMPQMPSLGGGHMMSGSGHISSLDTSMPSLQYSQTISPDDGTSPRQRRRLDAPPRSPQMGGQASPTGLSSGSVQSLLNHGINSPSRFQLAMSNERRESMDAGSPTDNTPTDDGDEVSDLVDVVGQLSIDENDQVRYHGKASGLHLLSRSQRHRDGIWRFPPARVWPPSENHVVKSEDEILQRANARDCLPAAEQQQHLVDLYFTYVHPVLPIIPKRQFMEHFRERLSSAIEPDSPQGPARGRVPTLLLLAMFSVAARYTSTAETPIPSDGKMWSAGDKYLEAAKLILNEKYASSQPETCQALILLSYREIGIGAMAQSFLYVGMAVRMAQDLGLHRSMEKWHPAGASRFTEEEKQTRRRIWWACVILDRYVSTYIGRPMAIFERDYDTAYTTEDDLEETDLWETLLPSDDTDSIASAGTKASYHVRTSHALACFNASASLSSILGRVYESLYTIRTTSEGLASERILRQLDKRLALWLINLPDSLKYQPSTANVPPPHILTLHMQFYCALLLLHRPFITGERLSTAPVDDLPSRAICTTAANAISTIISTFKEAFGLRRCPAILTYYIFSASIMHVFNATVDASDVQSRINLARCMAVLKEMDLVWPSAGRAWELLNGLVDLRDVDLSRPPGHPDAVRGGGKRTYPDEPPSEPPSELQSPVETDQRYLMHSRDSMPTPPVWELPPHAIHGGSSAGDLAWGAADVSMSRHAPSHPPRPLGDARSSENLHGQMAAASNLASGGFPLKHPQDVSHGYPTANGSGRSYGGQPGDPNATMGGVFAPYSPPRNSSFWNDQMSLPFGDPTLASAFMGLPVNLSNMPESFSNDVRGDGMFMTSLGTDRASTPEVDVPTSYHLLHRERSSQYHGGM